MSFLIQADNIIAPGSRRSFLGKSGLLLSGAAVALLAGQDALAAKGGASTVADVRILNTALGAELEAIAAYQLGAESGLLQKPVLDLAVTFQGHHKRRFMRAALPAIRCRRTVPAHGTAACSAAAPEASRASTTRKR